MASIAESVRSVQIMCAGKETCADSNSHAVFHILSGYAERHQCKLGKQGYDQALLHPSAAREITRLLHRCLLSKCGTLARRRSARSDTHDGFSACKQILPLKILTSTVLCPLPKSKLTKDEGCTTRDIPHVSTRRHWTCSSSRSAG